jgi:hypothetical protein
MLNAETRVVERDERGYRDMQMYKVKTTIGEDGTVTLTSLPFKAGEPVEIYVYGTDEAEERRKRYPLWGTVYRYDRPTDPVAEDDWEALR